MEYFIIRKRSVSLLLNKIIFLNKNFVSKQNFPIKKNEYSSKFIISESPLLQKTIHIKMKYSFAIFFVTYAVVMLASVSTAEKASQVLKMCAGHILLKKGECEAFMKILKDKNIIGPEVTTSEAASEVLTSRHHEAKRLEAAVKQHLFDIAMEETMRRIVMGEEFN